MLDRSLVESNRSVRVVLAYRRADEKAAGQLDIHGNFVANIQLVGKAALVVGIVNHIIVQTAVGGMAFTPCLPCRFASIKMSALYDSSSLL